MKSVHILASRDPIVQYALAPLLHNARRLRQYGYIVRIFREPSPECLSCAILCLISKPTLKLLGDKGPVFEETGSVVGFLKKARWSADRIVWMDDSDSTGVTHFELLPYVDRYLKKQLFRDRSLYRKEFYGGRIFSDFYHDRLQVEDDRSPSSIPWTPR